MGEICGDTRGVDNIVQCQLGDERRSLEEEGQWLLGNVSKETLYININAAYLSNSTRGTGDD